MTAYLCSHCGQIHEGLPSDWGYKLPDDAHALSYLSLYARVRHNADLCTLDESRYFIRTLLPVPLLEDREARTFNWGVWVEVDKPTHDLYLTSWDEDLFNRPRGAGLIANQISVYPTTIGLPVEIEYQPEMERPLVWLPQGTPHLLAYEQASGITGKRHHDILAALGHIESALPRVNAKPH